MPSQILLPPPQPTDFLPDSVSRGSRDTTPIAISPYSIPPLQSRAPSSTSINPRTQTSATDSPIHRREQNTRVSFYDPANQGTLDRLITGERSTQSDGEGDDENAIATMSNVEEMLEGYEWASGSIIGRQTAKGAADLIEARLLDELMALDKVFNS